MKTKITNLPIFAQLIMLFLGIVIFINASLITIFYFAYKKSVRDHVSEMIQQKYLSLENDFNSIKNELFQELNLLSNNSSLDDYLMSSENEKPVYIGKVKKMFSNHAKNRKEFILICFRNAYGEEKIVFGNIDGIFLKMDRAEKIIFNYLKNKPEGSIYIYGPYKDERGAIVFSAGIGKFDQDAGKFNGTINVTYDFSKFVKFIKGTRIFRKNPVWLYISGGDILNKPSNDKYSFNPSMYLQSEINTDSRVFSVKDGIYAYKDFFLIEEKPFVRVAFAVSSQLINMDAGKAISFFALIFIVSAVIAFAVVAFISKHFSKPIVELTDLTKDIAKGDFSKRIKIQATGELNYLVDNFNRMTETLQNTTVSRDLLAKEVAERKKAENKLIEYTKKVEDINKELDDFTYIVSHDLKEPLRSINAFSKFVISDYEDKLEEEGRNYLTRIQANADIMQKLIDDLLEISRLERRKNPFEAADTGNMLDEIKIRMERSLKEKKVEMVVRDKMPVIFCDRVRLTEVFANLISNAIKYADKIPPRVEVGYKETADHYEFFVKDNGPGIPEEYYEKIFKIFQRLVRKEEKEGTGVGLTIAKKIVEMHKGRIWVESKAGEGAIFYFTIAKNINLITEKKKIGEILVEKKIVDEDTIKKALEEQRRKEV